MLGIDERTYAGAVYDVIKQWIGWKHPFVLPNDIGLAWSYKGFIFGPALTVRGRKARNPDLSTPGRLIDSIKEPGYVYLLQANDNHRAHLGDIGSRFLKRAGCVGAVLQGWVRDIRKIEELGFPVWCKGVQPQDSSDIWEIDDFGCEIVIGNIFIEPGDYIFADADGAMVVKGSIALRVVSLLPEKLDDEEEQRQWVDKGKSATETQTELGRW